MYEDVCSIDDYVLTVAKEISSFIKLNAPPLEWGDLVLIRDSSDGEEFYAKVALVDDVEYLVALDGELYSRASNVKVLNHYKPRSPKAIISWNVKDFDLVWKYTEPKEYVLDVKALERVLHGRVKVDLQEVEE